MERKAQLKRDTNETQIEVVLSLDGSGKGEIDTGVGFFDHMLQGFARHGLFDLKAAVKGDLQVDDHHTIEDLGIVLGGAVREAIGDKKGLQWICPAGPILLWTECPFRRIELEI